MSAEKVYCLQVTEANHRDNAFWVLGGAGWLTKAEMDAAFIRIPSHVNNPEAMQWYIVDVLDEDGVIVDGAAVYDKPISADTARRLLGCSIEWRRRVAKRANAAQIARMHSRAAAA